MPRSGAGILPGSGIHPSDRWYGQQAVYRLSMGNFVRPWPYITNCVHAAHVAQCMSKHASLQLSVLYMSMRSRPFHLHMQDFCQLLWRDLGLTQLCSVLSLTVTCFLAQLFFGFMAAALLGVKYKGDKRDQYLHHGGWLLKLGLWLAFSAASVPIS